LNLVQDTGTPEVGKVAFSESQPQTESTKTVKVLADVNALSDEEIMRSLLQGKGKRNG
jgi:hypothetical protein